LAEQEGHRSLLADLDNSPAGLEEGVDRTLVETVAHMVAEEAFARSLVGEAVVHSLVGGMIVHNPVEEAVAHSLVEEAVDRNLEEALGRTFAAGHIDVVEEHYTVQPGLPDSLELRFVRLESHKMRQ
jgi:hypothetical protein